ncbi:unnamed protein product [Sphagnum troendelagicum]|uniref:Uncharacterized protein n=2 Tax=Sphagnum TaxID=13804 RepID=A0ABP0U006_9BRYO
MMCFFCTNAYKLVLPWTRKVHTQDIPLCIFQPIQWWMLPSLHRLPSSQYNDVRFTYCTNLKSTD